MDYWGRSAGNQARLRRADLVFVSGRPGGWSHRSGTHVWLGCPKGQYKRLQVRLLLIPSDHRRHLSRPRLPASASIVLHARRFTTCRTNMPPSPISSKSKRNARHAQRAAPPKRTNSEATSSSGDTSEFAAQSSDEEFDRASSSSSMDYQPEELDEPLTWAFKVCGRPSLSLAYARPLRNDAHTRVPQNGDPVWIKTEDGEWLQGIISGSNTRKGATRQVRRLPIGTSASLLLIACGNAFCVGSQKEGVFFPVAFRHNARKYFAPLNGDIKPDSVEVRRLLSEGGWL